MNEPIARTGGHEPADSAPSAPADGALSLTDLAAAIHGIATALEPRRTWSGRDGVAVERWRRALEAVWPGTGEPEALSRNSSAAESAGRGGHPMTHAPSSASCDSSRIGSERNPMHIDPAPLPAGASLVVTVPYTLTARLLREIREHRGCVEVSGPGGCGKTFSVDRYFADAEADVVKIHLVSRVKGHLFLRRLVEALGGVGAGGGDELMAELRAVVGTRRVYVYVDEADLLNRDSLRTIRYLRDQRDLWIAWVLVGTRFAEAYAKVPELWSRVTRRVSFAPLEGKALLEALAAYHPFLAAADPALLTRIDDEHCRGNWRVWSITLGTLLEYADRLGVDALTPQVAAAALGVSADRSRVAKKKNGARRPRRTA